MTINPRSLRPPARLTAALTAAVVLVFALVVPGLALAAGPGYRVGDFGDGRVMDILPPGENGLVNATDLGKFETAKTRPPNSDDQLGKYSNLLYGAPSLTDAGLGSYFNDESFGVRPGEVTKTEKPGPGVTIYRDKTGVPHVYGTSDQSMAFGAGYAQAEDRLFLMDVLRHYGAGTLSSFLGPSCDFEQMDHDQLLLAPYTPERAQKQVDDLPATYGAQGALAKSAVESYVKGVNAYIEATRTDPSLLPADYGAALGPPAADWKPADVVAIAGLIGGIFGKGGGTEVANAALLQYLQKQVGSSEAGRKAFDELKESNDPAAPTTTDKPFPYEATPASVDPATTAVPDDPRKELTGGPTAKTPGCDLTKPNATATRLLRSLKAMPRHMSNALVVNGDHTPEGHPTAVFGPQVSYFAPQILSVIDLHSPHYSAMGASFPGTGLVELGRGADYAWSATSAGSDLIDQRLEKVCNPIPGAPPEKEGKYYEFNGKCLPMTHEVYQETAVTKPGGIGAPTVITHDIYRTQHGVVQGFTTAGGKPVALVNQRSTYDHDIDSVVGFLHWGQPALTHDVKSWMDGAAQISFTFNWFYVDAKDTGYFTSGADPIRAPGADPNLPTWGTGNAEWQGFLPAAQHVQEINPAKGYFISWNNKPAPQFSAADDQYGYGPVFRSQMLVDQLQAQFARHGGKVTRSQLVQAMEGAASQDLDGLKVLPALLDSLKGRPQPPNVQAMLDQLRAWQADGAHRLKDKPGDAQYKHAAAVAIMDELEPALIRALFDPLLSAGGVGTVGSAGGATTQGYDILPMQFVNTPNSGGAHLGSAYDGGYEGYLQKLFGQLAGHKPAAPFSAAVTDHLCGAGGLSACPAAVDKALSDTFDALKTANGGSADVGSWTASTESANAKESMPAHDAIAFRALGIVGQPNIDWQNRPTYQQVVQFLRSRTSEVSTGAPKPSAPKPTSSPTHKSPQKAHHHTASAPARTPIVVPKATHSGGGSLPFTGYELALVIAIGLAAIAAGLAGRKLARERRAPDQA